MSTTTITSPPQPPTLAPFSPLPSPPDVTCHILRLPPEMHRNILRFLSTATCKTLREHYTSETLALCLLTRFGSKNVIQEDAVYNVHPVETKIESESTDDLTRLTTNCGC
ncbi:hypothetical protein HK102_005305, partial [Quaeritorhiza haematococci]